MKVGLIVEGQGDVLAVPILVRRVAQEFAGRYDVIVEPPMRVKRGKFAGNFDDYERACVFLARKVDALVTVLDADDDCPVVVGDDLRARGQAVVGHVPQAVTLAKSEFETWLLAGVESLRGLRGVSVEAAIPAGLEDIRSAKGRLDGLMSGHYSETVDQPALAAQFNIAEAREHAPSLDKLVRDLLALLA